MLLADVIQRLRDNATSLSSRVFGAVEFATARESTDHVTLPAAFVVPSADVALDAGDVPLVAQGITQDEFTVVLLLKNSTEIEGLTAAKSLETAKEEIKDALIGWTPSGFKPTRFSQGIATEIDTSVLWYSMIFNIEPEHASVVTYAIDLALYGKDAITIPNILAEFESRINSVLSATNGARMSSDWVNNLETIPASKTRYQLRSAVAKARPGSNIIRNLIFLQLVVHYHLPAGTAERTYTEDEMHTDMAQFLDHLFWRTGPGDAFVYEVVEGPDLAFPTDISRT